MAITKSDISKIMNAFSLLFNQKVEELELVTKKDLKYLPSKEEYFEREDKTMKELKAIREEHALLSAHSSNHSDRLENLEKIHPQNKHFAIT